MRITAKTEYAALAAVYLANTPAATAKAADIAHAEELSGEVPGSGALYLRLVLKHVTVADVASGNLPRPVRRFLSSQGLTTRRSQDRETRAAGGGAGAAGRAA